jgi:hypothetical protein
MRMIEMRLLATTRGFDAVQFTAYCNNAVT